MATLRDFSPEETARLGDEIYSRVVHPSLKPEDRGKVVAIDVRSEAWVTGDTGTSASRILREAHPDAEVWIVRVGGGAYHRLGGFARRTAR